MSAEDASWGRAVSKKALELKDELFIGGLAVLEG